MSDGEALLLAAGYDTSIHHATVVMGAGPQGQPVFVQRMPVTFRENANRGRTVAFPVFAHWMGKIREIAIGPVQEAMRVDLATGQFALITNHSDVVILDEVGWPEVIECRFYIGPWYGRASATADLHYDWVRVRGGEATRVATSRMTMTWARITGHGAVEPVPPPDYFRDFMNMMGPPEAGRCVDTSMSLPDPATFALPIQNRVIAAAPPSPRLRSITCERLFETTLEESNMVGNIYFSNYYVWQGRVRDSFINEMLPGVFRIFGNNSTDEPVCLMSSVQHLREAMPFDTIAVTMAVREVQEFSTRLYFEYFRQEHDGKRIKLAVGEHTLGWAHRDNGEPVMTPLPSPLRTALAAALQATSQALEQTPT